MPSDTDHGPRRRIVTVDPAAALAARPRLFAALEAAFPVSFEPRVNDGPADARIVFGELGAPPKLGSGRRDGVPVFGLCDGGDGPAPVEEVRLGEDPGVDRRLRGIALSSPLGPGPLRPEAGEAVLASAPSGPAWTAAEGTSYQVRSWLPELGPDEDLSEMLHTRALPLLALVHFLREVTTEEAFEAPPLRAVFLFDDPNLRWRTYGHIDYPRLIEHADAHGYHASMAMIPIDGWWRPHGATVELFRQRDDRLSLVLHGNNHVREELMQPEDHERASALVAQALRRVSRFEARHGVPVSRVMTPPHGVCSESTVDALGSLGFDALCSGFPLSEVRRSRAGRLIGDWEPAQFAASLAVIPRVPLTASRAELAIRAFLGQPLVLYGHHDDLAMGLDLLGEAAGRVNRLGDAQWLSLGQIAATNWSMRVEDGTVRVRPYSRRLRLRTPPGVTQLVVESPPAAAGFLRGWSADGQLSVPFDVPAPAGADLDLRLRAVFEHDPATIPAPAFRVWPVVRRLATELRDRSTSLHSTAWQLASLIALGGGG